MRRGEVMEVGGNEGVGEVRESKWSEVAEKTEGKQGK